MTPGATTGVAAPSTIGTARFHGQFVVMIYMQNTGGLKTIVYVPLHGAALPVEVDQIQSGTDGHIILSDWNWPITVDRPHAITTACTCG